MTHIENRDISCLSTIWADERVVIMADYGCYCWVGKEGEGTDLDIEFPNATDIEELHDAFLSWNRKMTFSPVGDDGRLHYFDWEAFHQEGIILCKWLKSVLHENTEVFYVKPFEDQESSWPVISRIHAD